MNGDVTQAGQPAAPMVDLETLRGELDGIDEQLLATLAARIQCCVRIAQYKREHEVPMMQPHRITIVQDRAAAFAAINGIDQTFIRRLYKMIITETCRVEDTVIQGAGPTDRAE
ncbi:MAG: chorismate mutase family protein [Pseudonocardiaceae bacterium]